MTTERFNELVNELRSASLDTLVAKNAGYSSDDDKLHNFHAGAEVMGGTAAQAAWGYATKHLVALRDKIQRNDFHDRDDFLEKCQDAINYICLIWCIGNEEMGKYNCGDTCVKEPDAEDEPKTYRDAIARHVPQNVHPGYLGGVLGCPEDYFHGAVGLGCTDCRCLEDCATCWNQPYKGEELIRHGGEE
jgi:hypothetical protein